MERELRCGYTTGTCAAAAAGAAVRLLLTGSAPEWMEVLLPSGERAVLAVEAVSKREEAAVCRVKKDAGDDPDVTDGTFVYVRASSVQDAGFHWYLTDSEEGICLTGGRGVGTVTKQGLSCPVGYPAINPVPRAMILSEAGRARREAGFPAQRLWITVSIPEGERLAARTFNPRLGIVGGISVLGTSGIVRPMSEEALRETIRLEIRVRAAQGRTLLAVAPGNYGEQFLREETGLSMDSFVKCSNFIGDAFCMMAREGIRRVLLAGHPGKLIKVAGGVLNTHSRYGDRRMEILSDCILRAGGGREIAEAVLPMNTTDEAAGYLKEQGLLEAVMGQAARQVKQVLEKASGITVEVMLFSGVYGLMAETDEASRFAGELGGHGGKRRRNIEETDNKTKDSRG